jgi:DNA replication and repair protein RecF
MKLAEGAISAAESGGDMPVFLFDDVLSELDIHRRTYLMHELRGRQVILTATDAEDANIVGGVRIIRVRNGEFISGGVAP